VTFYHARVGVRLTAVGRGTEVPVYVTPRAGKSAVVGEREGALWVRLAAPPVEGAANAALVALLAARLGVGKGEVRLVSGATGRRKRVRVGLPEAVVRERLGL
jgi:uncharacterized protein